VFWAGRVSNPPGLVTLFGVGDEPCRQELNDVRAVLDGARALMLLADGDGRILIANATARALSSPPEGDGRGQRLWEAPCWADQLAAAAVLPGMVDAAKKGERPLTILDCRVDGEDRHFEVGIGRIGGEGGSFLLEARDVSARTKLTMALQEAAARKKAVLDSALDPIVTIDAYGKILACSRSIRRVFGYEPEEVVGQNVRMLMPEPHRSAHDSYLANYRRTGVTNILNRSREFEALRKDGSRVPIELSVARVDVPGQDQPLFTGIIHEITERKVAERLIHEHSAALARSNKDLEQFAYVASHDLQEPLRMVGSFAGLLARRYQGKLDSEADEFIAYIVDGATRMQMLIEDLLAFSRVSTKGRKPEPVDAGEMVERVLGDLRAAIEQSGATVTAGALPMVLADPTQLGQVFLNLIGNAIKFRAPDRPPAVRVWAERLGGEWLFHVQDNGIGIDPRHMERIFHIFERLHGPGEYPGTGIGLAIVKKIIERHGGRIEVRSAPGEGSTFRFTLPAAERRT
jgi:PAS domain S-box-containing protein